MIFTYLGIKEFNFSNYVAGAASTKILRPGAVKRGGGPLTLAERRHFVNLRTEKKPVDRASVSDQDSGVFWIRIRIRNPDPGA